MNIWSINFPSSKRAENRFFWSKIEPFCADIRVQVDRIRFLIRKKRNIIFRKKMSKMGYCGSKVPYFFFPGISSFLCIFWEIRMNEWKSCFFFFRCRKKKTALKSNEWMACELFRGKKKKNRKISQKFQKSACVFFFPRFRKKKKHDFRIWMNEWPTNLSREKKKYGTFGQS